VPIAVRAPARITMSVMISSVLESLCGLAIEEKRNLTTIELNVRTKYEQSAG
jgi:hypothetical protein